MKTKSNKKKSNKTNSLRKINLKNVPKEYYLNNYKNTKLIPKTNIINYIFSNYSYYLLYKKICDSINTPTLSLDNCFLFDQQDFPSGLRKNEINISIKMNPNTSLDKLISYCFYIKQPFIFNKTINNALDLIKYQIGKDIKRDNRSINGKLYSRVFYQVFDDNYNAADIFYENIIDYMTQINKYIDLNMVNKIALLSCQNVFGLITDMITLKLNQILKPELSSIFRPNKLINITINKTNISMELNFKSQLIISKDGGIIDPEYPCGYVDFILYIDLLNNIYELKKFILIYDIDKCGPELPDIIEENPNKSKFKAEYIIPTGILSAGIIATPILLATLGGKSKKNKTRKLNKKINKK